MKKRKLKIRYCLLVFFLSIVTSIQIVPQWGRWYGESVYPVISRVLITFSSRVPFSIGDVFIILSILALIGIPLYGRMKYRKQWKTLLWYDAEYLLWIYVWFYAAWGLNYSQPDFYRRTHIKPVVYTTALFNRFVDRYVTLLNRSYVVSPKEMDKRLVYREIPDIYRRIGDSLKVHTPQNNRLRVKTMLFSDFIASMGVSGYMGPFFCEFNLNGNIQPVDYPATYAHEMAHLLGISSEAEANFYAYEVCTRSKNRFIRFSGYFFVMGYVLSNAKMVMTDKQFNRIRKIIRPEIRRLYNYQHYYWQAMYSPALGAVQDWIYNLYLKGNKIKNGQKNYFQVVGLLISYEHSKDKI